LGVEDVQPYHCLPAITNQQSWYSDYTGLLAFMVISWPKWPTPSVFRRSLTHGRHIGQSIAEFPHANLPPNASLPPVRCVVPDPGMLPFRRGNQFLYI
jgi:hypothetical protein